MFNISFLGLLSLVVAVTFTPFVMFVNISLAAATITSISTTTITTPDAAHYFQRVVNDTKKSDFLFYIPKKDLEPYDAVHKSRINFEPLMYFRYSMDVQCLPECRHYSPDEGDCSISFMLNKRWHVHFSTSKDDLKVGDLNNRLVELMILYNPRLQRDEEYLELQLIDVATSFGCTAYNMRLEFVPQPQKIEPLLPLQSYYSCAECVPVLTAASATTTAASTAAASAAGGSDENDDTDANDAPVDDDVEVELVCGASDGDAAVVSKEAVCVMRGKEESQRRQQFARSSHATILSHVLVLGGGDDTAINTPFQAAVNTDITSTSTFSSSFSSSSTSIGSGTPGKAINKQPRLLCSVYTIEGHHSSHIMPLVETWAGKCTGFLVFSNVTDREQRFPSVAIPHLGPEKYDLIWQKVRSIWSYIFTHYKDDFDWFYLSGDDSYVIVENLMALLAAQHVQEQHKSGHGTYLGRMYYSEILVGDGEGQYRETGGFMYNHGGPGYVLDRAALTRFFTYKNEPQCLPLRPTSMEDQCIAYCLSRTPDAERGLLPFNTADELNRQRFHVFPPGDIARKPLFKKDYFHVPNCDQVDPANCVSSTSVAFHDMDGDLMRSMHDYLYNSSV